MSAEPELLTLLRELDGLFAELQLRGDCVFTVCHSGHARVVVVCKDTHYCACAATHEDAVRRVIHTVTLEKHAARKAPGGTA